MSGSRHDWLDEETAERLLRGEPVAVEITGISEFDRNASQKQDGRRSHALIELLRAASAVADTAVQPEREEAALAAFRQAHADALAHDDVVAVADVDADVVVVGDGRGRGVVVEAGHRFGRLRGWPGSAKVAMAAAVTATVLASGVTAAAVGVIPSPFTGGGALDPAPHASGPHRPSIDASEFPQMSGPAGSASATPNKSGAASGLGKRPPGGTSSSSGGTGGAPRGQQGSDAKGTSGDHDANALCHTYLDAESGHGAAVQRDSLNWLIAVAGGQTSVDPYCRERLGHAAPHDSSSVVLPAPVDGGPSAAVGSGTGSGGRTGDCPPQVGGATSGHGPGQGGSGGGGHGSCGAGSGGAGPKGGGSGGAGPSGDVGFGHQAGDTTAPPTPTPPAPAPSLPSTSAPAQTPTPAPAPSCLVHVSHVPALGTIGCPTSGIRPLTASVVRSSTSGL